jgi:phosphohistidine phosphatase SixA
MRKLLPLALWCALLTTTAQAQGIVVLVRHAERADTVPGAAPTMGADPSLSEAGRARAASLAATLKDARITDIFVTEYKRTQETAAPLAQTLKLTPVVVPAKDVPGLVARLKATNGTALVVGHSNTVPEIIGALGVKGDVAIGDAEYDNLFVVTPATAQALRLRFH